MAFLNEPLTRVEPVDTDQVALLAEAYCHFGKATIAPD